MDVEGCLERLGDGRAAWNRWRSGEGFLDPIHLEGVVLDGRDLRGYDLAGARLSTAVITDSDLSGARLIGADLSDSTLRDSDLTGAELIGAQLMQSDATAATFVDADLSEANLQSVDLARGDLRRANLADSDISYGDLTGADLSGAGLRSTNLTAVKLDGARLTRAVVSNTLFANNDLSGVIDLATLRHWSPSTIGVDTLFRSGPGLPAEFFRGCGLPDSFVAYIDSHVSEISLSHYRTFLSYSTQDGTFADRLYSDLFYGRGIPTWMDKHQIVPGDHLDEEIDRAINVKTDRMILVCSRASLSGESSWWIDREVSRALAREREHQRREGTPLRYLIPVAVDSFLMSSECTYARKQDLIDRNVAVMDGWETDDDLYRRQLSRIVNALRVGGPITPGGFRST